MRACSTDACAFASACPCVYCARGNQGLTTGSSGGGSVPSLPALNRNPGVSVNIFIARRGNRHKRKTHDAKQAQAKYSVQPHGERRPRQRRRRVGREERGHGSKQRMRRAKILPQDLRLALPGVCRSVRSGPSTHKRRPRSPSRPASRPRHAGSACRPNASALHRMCAASSSTASTPVLIASGAQRTRVLACAWRPPCYLKKHKKNKDFQNFHM